MGMGMGGLLAGRLVVLSRVVPPDAVAFARSIPGSVLAAKAALRAQSATQIGLRWAVGGSRDRCVRVGGSSSIFLVVLSWVVPPDSVAFARPSPVSGLSAMCAFLSQCNPAWGIICGRAFSGCKFSAASGASRSVFVLQSGARAVRSSTAALLRFIPAPGWSSARRDVVLPYVYLLSCVPIAQRSISAGSPVNR